MKKRNTKRSLIASIMSLVLCITMLLGTTLAWFTDSVSSGVNRIQAGNLDIEVEYSKDGNSWASIENTTSLFSSDLWEPGHTEYVYLRVKNVGSLALKYKVMVSPISENGGINVYNNNFKLSDHLVFGTTGPSTDFTPFSDRTAARNAVGSTTKLNQSGLTKSGNIVAGTSAQYMALVVYMPESVDNVANAKPGTKAPSIDLGIKVVATQLKNESDSFGNDYDAVADQTEFYQVGAYYDYFEAVNVSATADSDGKFTVTANDGNEDVIAEVTGQASSGSTVNLVVTKVSTPTGNFGIQVDEGEELNGYDIKVTGQEKNSLVQGKLYVGTGLENFKFYHNGQLMAATGNEELANNEYRYDTHEGYVHFATTSFSPFQATYKAPVAAIGTSVYGTLDNAIVAANSGETITLLKDAVGKGIGSKDGDKTRESLTIDFNGHTYTMNDPAVGSTGTETQAMHWGESLGGVTLKNGTFKVAENTQGVKMAMQNYIDFTAENMNFDFTNIPVDHYGITGNFDPETGKYKEYSGLEVPMFNNNSGYMVLNNTVINMPSASTKGISADGKGVDIINCTINGYVNLQDSGSSVRIKDSSVNGVVSYFDNGYIVKTSEKDGYTVYTNQTVVNISDKTELNNAITNATDRNVNIAIASAQAITLDSGIADRGDKSRDITFIGDDTQTVDVITDAVSAEGGMLNYQRGSSFTFKNLTIQAGEGNYDGIVCDELTYINCTIKGKLTLYGKATFINCVFENDMADQYSIWTWGGTDVTFENCTFNTNGKAILLYGAATESNPTRLVVNNCTFNDRNNGTVGKAAIEIGNDYGATYTLTVNNATVNGFADGKNTGSKLWANKNSMDADHLTVTIDGIEIQ